jgi:hypothetical protein
MKTLVQPAAVLSTLTLSLFAAGNLSAQDYWGDTAASAAGTAAVASGNGYVADTAYTVARGGFGSLLGESDFNYGYLDASYYWFDFDEDNFDNASGFGAALSIPIADSLYIKGAANYAASETESGDDVDYLDWQAGVGIGLPLMRRIDLILEGGLAHRSIEVDGIDDFGDLTDGYGWYVAPGVRVGINDYVEINGTVRYISVDETDDLGVDINALIHLTQSISLKGGVLFSDDANQYGVGIRIHF